MNHKAQSLPPSAGAVQRRGACPSLAAPMQTGDGLLARLRPVGRRLSPGQLRLLARLASEHGNGQVEVTARGNLQVRGLRPETHAPFADAVLAEIDIEDGLVIDLSPLAGLDPAETADPRPIAEAIARLVEERGLLDRLGPKVAVVVDGGGSIGLGQLGADIRLRATSAGDWSAFLAGKFIGTTDAIGASSFAAQMLERIAQLGPEARAKDLQTPVSPFPDAPIAAPGPTTGLVQALADRRFAVHFAIPFGATDSAAVTALADLPVEEFLLAPDHGLIAIVESESAGQSLLEQVAALGFVTRADDARRAIKACVGNAGCASGTIPARRIAEQLAALTPDFFDGSFTLHVSGCAKGCAFPRPALLTLVGDGEDALLVIGGRAKDVPSARFTLAEIPSALQRLASLWRRHRRKEENVADCFARLGTAAILAAARQG